MKKIKITLAALLMIAVTACEDQLNQTPISNPSTANFYKNASDFKQAVNGVYSALNAGPQIGNGYAIRRFDLSEIRSDNIYGPGTSGVRDRIPINNFESTLSTNPYMTEAWSSNFAGILRANTILDQLNSTVVPDDPTRLQIEGETKFLRAFFYFDLVRLFGKVPLISKNLTPEQSLTVPRSSVSDVYGLIISDLNTAVTNLPTSFSGTDKGRATSLAAKTLLGLVYLTRSGATYGIEGPGLGLNEYALAVQNFNDVIASGKFSFVATYASIFSWTNEGNQDIIFDIQAIGGSTGDLGLGARFPTELIDADYATAQGIPFAGGVEGDAPKSPSLDLVSSFEAGDVRKTFSILPSYTKAGNVVVTNYGGQYIKFWDKTKAGVDRFNWSLNYPVFRYTDVLMMKAEAILRGGFGSSGSQGDVDAIVNQVRGRAGLGTLSNVTMDQLLNERRHEFMGEGLRWHDLVRSGNVVTVMNAWRTKDDTAKKIKAITANHIIYPVPLTQLTVSPGLYDQNPGY